MEPNDIISQSKAAKDLGVSRQVINERLKAGTLTAYKDRFGIIRVSEAEVQSYEPRRAGRKAKSWSLQYPALPDDDTG